MSARETTVFKSLVTFDSCMNYKQQCKFCICKRVMFVPNVKNLGRNVNTHARTQRTPGCQGTLQRPLSKLVYGAEEHVISFERVQHEDKTGRNGHVEIHSSQVMKTMLRLYKDYRSWNLQQNFIRWMRKKDKHRRNNQKDKRINGLHPKTLHQRRNVHEEPARSVSRFSKTLDTTVSF